MTPTPDAIELVITALIAVFLVPLVIAILSGPQW